MGDAGTSPRVGVLCVDDNPLVAHALKAKLRDADDLCWLGHIESADALVPTALEVRPTIVILDIDMPGRDPFDAMRELLMHDPEVRVVMCSGLVDRSLLDRALAAGAWGYVSKCDGEDAIVRGIRAAASGEFALSQEARLTLERG